MTTGEGGMLVTDDGAIAEQVRLCRSHGMTSLTWDRHQGHAWSYDVVALGYNYRIDEIRSALGCVQLAKLERNNALRSQLTQLYASLLQDRVPSVTVPFLHHPGSSAHYILPALLPVGCDRIAFMEHMKACGIQTSIHYPPVHTFTAFKVENDPHRRLPLTEAVAMREVTLPLYPSMTRDQVVQVVEAVCAALRNH